MTSGAIIIDYNISVAHEVMMTDDAIGSLCRLRKRFVVAVFVVYRIFWLIIFLFILDI